jgi:DNA-binding NtrC family response regulator
MPDDVLIYARDGALIRSLQTSLTGCGYHVETSDAFSQTVQKLLSTQFGVLVLGVYIDDAESLEMIALAHQIDAQLPIVTIGDRESLQMERKVRLEKVFYYMVQPIDRHEVETAVHQALEKGGRRGKVQR